MSIKKIILCTAIAVATALTVMYVISDAPGDNEVTAKISVKNFGGKELEVQHTSRGVFNGQLVPLTFGADSTAVISIPTDGIEYMSVIVTDVKGDQRPFSKSIYLLPGITEVNVDPVCDEPINVTAPTGNPVDGEVADALSGMKNIYYDLMIIDRADELGIRKDSVASEVSRKFDHYIDSVCSHYSAATPKLLATLRNNLRLGAMLCILVKYGKYKGIPEWDAEFEHQRSKIDLSASENAICYYYPSLVRQLYSIDTGNNVIWSVPDSLISTMVDYAVETLSPKGAEALIGDILYDDGAGAKFSRSVPALTERFKTLYPQSSFIPMLEVYSARNIAYNNPVDNPDIHFRDNSSVKTVADILRPYNGRRIFIDIWHTYSYSCIAGISDMTQLQQYANANDIQLLYIALDESNNEKRWKDMALAYNLIGDHIMINPTVRQDIFDTFGKNGYMTMPLYAIVDSDGNIMLLPRSIAESHDFEPLQSELEKIK